MTGIVGSVAFEEVAPTFAVLRAAWFLAANTTDGYPTDGLDDFHADALRGLCVALGHLPERIKGSLRLSGPPDASS